MLLLLLLLLSFSASDGQQIVQLTQAQSYCSKDIVEDICPQRYGFDEECDRRCLQMYPMRIDSICRARSTGTLLSFFGIRSFVCTCRLANIACVNIQFAMHPFHITVVQQNSILTAIPSSLEPQCSESGSNSCLDSFTPPTCNWHFSKEFQWYSAISNGSPVGSDSPTGTFLAGTSQSGATWASVSTCDGLCSKSSVSFTAKIWRPPTVVVELCFKERDSTMCAPVQAANGKSINEVVPETEFFQVMLRFSNVSLGEMVLIDDLSINYEPCALQNSSAVVSTEAPPVKTAIQRRMCHGNDCLHSASHLTSTNLQQQIHRQKMCVGRAGMGLCRQKCLVNETNESSARCIRQRDNPIQKRCICQVRRAPEVSPSTTMMTTTKLTSTTTTTTASSTDEIASNRIITTNDDEPVCSASEHQTCAFKCGSESMIEVCRPDECECRRCTVNMCNFEEHTRCEWADLRMLSEHFNNISVAMKKGDENRYGISRLNPDSYSGLLHKSDLVGPIMLTIDVFPSHEIEVRICVENLRKCQTQALTARSWNRISAKIKVAKAEKMFILFHNADNMPKSIAIDNIAFRNGTCA